MSSLQTMTAPSVGHNRPPDPGIVPTNSTANTANTAAARTTDAIGDNTTNTGDDFSQHDYSRAVNANANAEINADIDSKNRELSALHTDVATPKQNGSVDRMPRPQDPEVNKDGDSSAVADKRTEEFQEKEGERKIKEEPQDAPQQGGEQDPAEKDSRKDVPDDMLKVKEDSTADKPAENHNQLLLQDSEKQSAATSLLAQLLGNVNAQAATPEYLPRTPLPEPLTDASTPAAPNEDVSLSLMNGQTEEVVMSTKQTEVQNGDVSVPKQEGNAVTETQNQPLLQTDTPFEIPDDSANTRIPDMVTGVMEDPLSKTNPDHSTLFAPFDADGSIKNGLDALQQHDLLSNAFLSQEINMSGLPDLSSYSQYDVAASIAGSEPRIQAFAKLEFDDGHFYVNTYSFILGRDVRAARAAFQREVQVRQAMRPSRNKSSSGGNTSHTPNRVKRDGSAYVGSVVSDRGGIMGFDPDVPHHISQISRRSSVSSQPDSMLHATPAQLQANHTDYNALAMQSLYDGSADAKPVDMLALLPSPDACPTIPIHPPATADGSSAGHKGISRKHVKIAYNFDKNFFEMEVMGRNGAFIGADWLAPGQVRPLHSGDYIQIGGVRIRFLLPDVPIGETGADRLEEPLLEDGTAITREATEAATGDVDAMEEHSDDESQDGTKRPRVTKLILKTKSQDESANADAVDANGESQPKRRGPGRPPKDGIMSKRERAEIAREQKLAAKREANGGVTPPPPLNRPKPPTTTKPRKEDSVEEVVASTSATPAAPATPSKPVEKKSVKRKQPDGSIIDVPIESIEGGEQQPLPEQQPVVEYPKPPPPKKRKPSRSPSPDYPPESAYTQDQMAKPPYNYAVLIFDALTESRTPMTLKQIYRALKLKYPYFRFKCETEGWTSSVRHNLNGNRQLFEHAERDGKGWSWQLRAGASVEKEKKRRPSPPPPSSHIHQPPHHYMPPPSHSYTNQSLQNQQFQFSAMPNTFNPPPAPTYRPPVPPAPPVQTPAPNPFKNINLPPALTNSGSTKYVSPYPCALPPDILQLQQENQPKPPTQSAPQHQHQQPPMQMHQPPPPPSQPQQQPQYSQPQPHQQQQPPPTHYTPNGPPYQPPANNQIPPYPPQPSQGPSPSPSQQPAQPYQPPQQQQPPQQPPQGAPMINNTNNNQNGNGNGNNTNDQESSLSFLERANKAIDDFEAVLMEDYDDKNYIREVLKSARARALGHADKSSFPDGEPKDEAVLLDVLRNLIGSLKDE
jgi:hypothetical protein